MAASFLFIERGDLVFVGMRKPALVPTGKKLPKNKVIAGKFTQMLTDGLNALSRRALALKEGISKIKIRLYHFTYYI
jgi:hypothetical protein